MNITFKNKLWRFAYDKEVTLEIIAALFKANFNLKNGISHMLIDDLVQYLFYIDMNNLIETSSIVTGLSYYFNKEGKLRSGELYQLIDSDNKGLFTVYTNMYNRYIIKMTNIDSIGTDNLCVYTEELISNVYYRNISNKVLAFLDLDFDEIFNTSTVVKRNLRHHIKYITLDYLVDVLELDREGVIENLSLHNVGRLNKLIN